MKLGKLGRPGSPVWVVCLSLWLFNAGYGFVSFHFGGLQFLMAATIDDLMTVDGIGDQRARTVREGLSRMAEASLLDRFL